MEYLFYNKRAFGDLSNWDVSNVTNMHSMFARSEFWAKGVENWSPKNLEDCEYMFCDTFYLNDGPLNLNNFSKNLKKMRTHAMFNNFYMDDRQTEGVEVDITSWDPDIIDEESCFGMFGGEYINYSKEYLEEMKAWIFNKFHWSTISFDKLFADTNEEKIKIILSNLFYD